MMAAKVFRIHKRVIIPGEIETPYSIEDFCKNESSSFENFQFYMHNGSGEFDLNDASYFEIKRKTLNHEN